MSGGTIFQILPKITKAVQPIAKSRENKQQGYAFRGVEDVYAMLNLLLADNGVTILPEVIDSVHESFASKSGGVLFRSRLLVRYHLVAADGSEVCAVVAGEGMDSGDKATPKALSCAYKYMAFQVFCIPTGDKIDAEEESHEVAQTNGEVHSVSPRQQPGDAGLFEELKQALANARTREAINDLDKKAQAAKVSEPQRKMLTALATARRTFLGAT